jgi:PAS domain S-box-containing protein
VADTRRGLLAGGGVLAALVVLDILVGDTVNLTGAYMLAGFVAAAVGDVRAAAAVAVAMVAAGAASGAYNHDFGHSEWAAREVLLVIAGGVSIVAARTRMRSLTTLRRQRLLGAVAELPRPSASLEATVASLTELLVPDVAAFAAVDRVHEDEMLRIAFRGDPEVERSGERLDTPLRAREREIGRLTIARPTGRPYDADEREFMAVLADRMALALDNAGLSHELMTVEQQLDAILRDLGEAVTVQDRNGRLVFANRAAVELLGASSIEELISTPPMEFVTRFETFNEDGTPLRLEQLPGRQVLEGREAEPLLLRAINRQTGEERWRLTKATPVVGPDGAVALAVNIIEDVTEAKRAEHGQRLLAEASGVLASSLDYEDTLQRVAELAVPQLADWCSVSMPRGDQLVQMAIAHSDPEMIEWARSYAQRYPSRLDGPGGAARVMRSGQSELIPEVTEDIVEMAALEDEQREAVEKLGMSSVMIVPMSTPDRTVGVITMVTMGSRRRFTEADLALAKELGRRAGTALENARLYTELSDVAHTLQQSLLPPDLPQVAGWRFGSLYMPAAGESEVGGDFYDVFPTAAGWMAVIGDVVGRGAAAASLTAMARYTLRTAGSLVGTPTMGLARLNENLRERGEMALCTAAVVLLRDEAEEASVVSAGHPLPVLIRNGEPQEIGRTGPLLGAFDHGHWLPASVQLQKGDVVVLFTDGVIDARGTNGHGRFGEQRLMETLSGARSVEDAVGRIRDALADFGGGEHTDDTAVLALQRV